MSETKGTNSSTAIIAAIIGASAVVAAAVIGLLKNYEPPINRRTPPALEIKQPTSGQVVSAKTKPNGSAAYFPVTVVLSGTPEESHLGIYILVFDGGGWWVQDRVDAKEGASTLEAWVGGDDNKPQSGANFRVRAVLANIDAVEQFKQSGAAVSEDAKELGRVVLSTNTPSLTLGAVSKP